MPFPGALRKLEFEDGPKIVFGLNDTRAEVANEYPHAPIGTIYICAPNTGSTGRVYVKVTHTAKATAADWEKITTSAAD